MPPKKPCSRQAQKGALLFVEPPKQGPVHRYGSPLRSAGSPRGVPTKSASQMGSSWIIPQFESATSVGFQRWRLKRPNVKNQDSSQVMGRSRRATAHKFLPLQFEDVRTSSCAGKVSRCPVDCCGQAGSFAEMHPNQPTAVSTSPTTRGSGACLEGGSQWPLYANHIAFSPPDRHTPEHPSYMSACNGCLPQMNSFTPGPQRSFVGGDNSCGGDMPVLVRDTPEHEYGVRVTWRRRSLLMKYLREKGVLSTSDTLVQT
ncbi:hypothetical protein lerEdw1_012033 [Lerista edwardsae]|nr:hypothetical protein lerEdw1_012033 [Lerista edwardsae]